MMLQSRSHLNGLLSMVKGAAVKKNNSIAVLSLISKPQQQQRQEDQKLTTTRFFSQTKQVLEVKDGPVDYGYTSPDDRFNNNQPTIQYAKTMPNSFSSMRHEQILQLCVEGSFSARKEALIRNVMAVDSIAYDEAEVVVKEISKCNSKGMVSAYLPYHIGMGASLIVGAASFPMIFDLNTVQAFNEKFVTAELPDLKDLETSLEVASCSWSWMEPLIGQTSFVLLLLQFARNQAINLGIKPYGDWARKRRANYLISEYPQYDEVFVKWFSEASSLYGARTLD